MAENKKITDLVGAQPRSGFLFVVADANAPTIENYKVDYADISGQLGEGGVCGDKYEIQFNSGGLCGADPYFTYNYDDGYVAVGTGCDLLKASGCTVDIFGSLFVQGPTGDCCPCPSGGLISGWTGIFGRVGIGTTTPEAQLHITGGDGNFLWDNGVNINSSAYALNTTGNIRFYKDTTPHYLTLVGTTNEVGYNLSNSQSNWTLYVDDSTYGDLPSGGLAIWGGTSPSNKLVITDPGQVGIGTADPSAPLEVFSTSGGVIMPRMTTTQMNAIPSPANGEMIYNTSSGKFAGYAGDQWVSLH